ncbi:Uncharacterised protein [Legionella feeleii]|uniref:Uncharacterized protein n=1 Tax=Legionella feeleii TaxID=453 RepID=A0A378IS72_9GAMM|nr:Uncharacterised protein [Legionella feeleii]
MKNSRKQLIIKIEKLDKNLHKQQIKVRKHYHCLTSFINSTDALIGLIPAFIIGWGSAKGSFIKNMLKYIIRIEFLTILATLGKKFIR